MKKGSTCVTHVERKNNNKVHKLSTFKEKLSEVQTTLLAFDFELMEILSPDEDNDKDVSAKNDNNDNLHNNQASDYNSEENVNLRIKPKKMIFKV